MMDTFRVKEAFVSIQGEGFWAGTLAVFLRFSGCNLWCGTEEGRAHAKGSCGGWCDTDFIGTDGQHGGEYFAGELLGLCEGLWGSRPRSRRLVVFTGGEPTLQVTEELVRLFQDEEWRVHIETNGTRRCPHCANWITLSPKTPLEDLVGENRYSEIKLVLTGGDSDLDPTDYQEMRYLPNMLFVQPADLGSIAKNRLSMEACYQFVQKNPVWRVGAQLHKILGVE